MRLLKRSLTIPRTLSGDPARIGQIVASCPKLLRRTGFQWLQRLRRHDDEAAQVATARPDVADLICPSFWQHVGNAPARQTGPYQPNITTTYQVVGGATEPVRASAVREARVVPRPCGRTVTVDAQSRGGDSCRSWLVSSTRRRPAITCKSKLDEPARTGERVTEQRRRWRRSQPGRSVTRRPM